MNTRIHKGLAVIAMLFCLVFVATNVVAKKPIKPPPEPDPPVGSCETSEAFFPAFMFWRNQSRGPNTEFTVYLASEDGACVRPLVDVPDSRNANWWHSAFSYNETSNLGRVVWQKGGRGDDEWETWLQEFTVVGNTIAPPPAPELILVYPDDANMDVIAYGIPDIDISADLKNVAFTLYDVRLDGISSETHVVEIDACKGLNPPCTPGTDTLILRDIQQYDGRGPIWWRIAWGPLGERIYLDEDTPGGEWAARAVRMVTRIGDTWTDRYLFTTDEYPEYAGLSDVTSGISGDGEKLAIRHGGDCSTISVIDVAECEEVGLCKAEAQFFGIDPSWTDRGTIIHTIGERGRLSKRLGRYVCSYTIIGEGNPITSEVTPLIEGENPDAG